MGRLTRPTLPEIYLGNFLCKGLDRARKQPLIWASGPGGCGKTALVSGYPNARKISGLWYQVKEGDKDPATFFYYLGQATPEAISYGPVPGPGPVDAFGTRTFRALGKTRKVTGVCPITSPSPWIGKGREDSTRTVGTEQ